MVLAEVQRKRLLLAYGFLDANENGVLDEEDFLIITNKICDDQKLPQDDPFRAAFVTAAKEQFQKILALCDTDENGEVDSEEWLNYFDSVTQGKKHFSELNQDFQDFWMMFFDMFDLDHNSNIDFEEYSKFLKIFSRDKLSSESILKNWNKIVNGKKFITRDMYIELSNDHLMNPDPNSLSILPLD